MYLKVLLSELISETGGSLGLFLGLSLVDIFLCGTGNFHNITAVHGITAVSDHENVKSNFKSVPSWYQAGTCYPKINHSETL